MLYLILTYHIQIMVYATIHIGICHSALWNKPLSILAYATLHCGICHYPLRYMTLPIVVYAIIKGVILPQYDMYGYHRSTYPLFAAIARLSIPLQQDLAFLGNFFSNFLSVSERKYNVWIRQLLLWAPATCALRCWTHRCC